ncbi:hypothetical protein CK228_31040 [Mesorhizobium sp. WSM4312]|nr:hypothetical protein CK228_31040 [Mesorhizobium sp. WSM4312]
MYDYLNVEQRPRVGRLVQHDPREWRVTDNLPKPVPVTSPEIDAFEAWFGDIFDQLFGDRP